CTQVAGIFLRAAASAAVARAVGLISTRVRWVWILWDLRMRAIWMGTSAPPQARSRRVRELRLSRRARWGMGRGRLCGAREVRLMRARPWRAWTWARGSRPGASMSSSAWRRFWRASMREWYVGGEERANVKYLK